MANTIKIEIDERTVRRLVMEHVNDIIGTSVKEEDVKIEVKSTQNYRSEWELANFRATVRKFI